MRFIISAVTLTVSTMSFGEGININSPAYRCQLVSYESSLKSGEVKINQQILIVPNNGNLFEAYTMTTETDQYFQFFTGDRAKNQIIIDDNEVMVSFDNGKYVIYVNENTGQGYFEQKAQVVGNFLFGKTSGNFQKGLLEGCQRLQDERQAWQLQTSFYQAREKQRLNYWASVNE